MKLFKTLLTAAAAIALSGCTSSDVVDDILRTDANRIGFNTSVSKGSRALTNTNFSRFYVFGSYTMPTQSQPITVFSHVLVSKNDAGSWTYEGDQYWNPDGTYDFYAYSCENSDMDPSVGTWGLNGRILNLNEVEVNAAHQHDLLFAKVTGERRPENNTTANPVAFKFNHILTRVKFTFGTNFPAGYKTTVSNVRIENFRDMGTFLGSSLAWSNVKRSADNVAMNLKLPTTSADISSTTVSTEAAYFVPFAYEHADVRLLFDIDVMKDGVKVLGRTITATWQPNWQAGHSINNNITINVGTTGVAKISFTATIGGDAGADADGWSSDTGALNNLHFDAGASN